MTPILQPPALDIDAQLQRVAGPFPANIAARRSLEQRIVWNVLHQLNAAGWNVHHDADDSTYLEDNKAAMEWIFNLDVATIVFANAAGRRATVVFVLGNGFDVLADYSMSLDPVLKNHNGEDYEEVSA